MGKVGILNLQYSNHNYGAVLQAAALQTIVENLGYDAEHIDLRPQDSLLASFRKALGRVKRRFFGKTIGNSETFEDFRKQWLYRSERVYRNLKELQEVRGFDAVIVGSDQVWRTRYRGYLTSAFFLSFVPDSCKKIAYAASFGVDSWEEDHNSEEVRVLVHNLMSRFDAISVREASGIKICHEQFGVTATHVYDPTLVVGRDFFERIITSEKSLSEKTADIVYYKLDVDASFATMVQDYASQKGMEVENIYHVSNSNGRVSYNSIPTWLLKIREATLVITDSFHCICFALLFEKEFVYFPPITERGYSRIESLLGELDLLDRVFDTGTDFVRFLNAKSEDTIDYESVNMLIKKRVNFSRNFLNKALMH